MERGSKGKNVEDIYPLSPLQRGLLFETLYERDAPVYLEQIHCTLTGTLDVAAFQRAWELIVERTPPMRTRFAWEGVPEPVQVVRRTVTLPFTIEDWRGLDADAQTRRFAALLEDDRRRGFDLAKAPLVRCALVRLADDRHRFLFSHHHIILDGWSGGLVYGDVLAAYDALRRGQAPALPPRRPFRDYIAWLATRTPAASEAYWRQALAGIDQPTPLAFDAPEAGRAGGWVETALDRETTRKLNDVARAHQLTPSTLILGGWALLLARYADREDVVFGTTVSGRPPAIAGVDAMVGNFINTLPLRVHVPRGGGVSVGDWLRTLQAAQAELREHEHSALTDVQKWSEMPSGQALYDSFIAIENFPVDQRIAAGEGGLAIGEVDVVDRTNFPIAVGAVLGAELQLRIVFDGSRFERAAVDRMLTHFVGLLRGLAEDLARPVDHVPLLGAHERRTILSTWNATAAAASGPLLLHQMIEEQVSVRPDAEAVRGEQGSVTYAELDRRATRLAVHLQELGVGPEVRVGVIAARSIELVVGLYAVLKAGGVYIPLDPEYPRDRLEHMLDDAGVAIVLAAGDAADELPDAGRIVIALDDEDAWGGVDGARPTGGVSEDNLAYVIYTSGSTGRPKGAMNTHRGIVNYLSWLRRVHPLAAGDRVLLQTSVSFDISGAELYWPLVSGGTVVLAKPGGAKDPAYLVDVMKRERVAATHMVPSGLKGLLEAAAPGELALKRMITGGEELTRDIARRYLERVGGALVNLYGPTETAVDVTGWTVDLARRIAIGKPIANTRLYVLDGRLEPTPVGVPGELYIGGANLGRGYVGRADETARRFVPDPFGRGERLYRTGDLVRWSADGEIEFIGRADEQVKVRGYRIELGEIEAALEEAGAREAAAVVRDEGGEKRLVGYVVGGPDADELRQRIRARLPEYMVPWALVALDAIPRTPNGKVDRRALPAPDRAGRAEKVAPRTEAERALAKIWSEVLRIGAVSVDDNFFELGGDSILSIQVVSRAKAAGLTITPWQVFEHQTIAQLAAVAKVSGGEAGAAEPDDAHTGPALEGPIQQWFRALASPDPNGYLQAIALDVVGVPLAIVRQAVDVVFGGKDLLRFAWGEGPLDLERGPLARAILDETPGALRLELVIHHMVVDGVSWRVLLDELATAVGQLRRGEPITLPAKTTSYRRFVDGLAAWATSPAADGELAAWTERLRPGAERIPLDADGADDAEADEQRVVVELGVDETRALLEDVPRGMRAQAHEALLAALGQALGEWTGRGAVQVDVEGHGREAPWGDVDVARTIGWFTSVYPIALPAASAPGAAIDATKDALRAVRWGGVGYGALRYLGRPEAAAALSALPGSLVSWNYLGQLDTAVAADSPFRLRNEGARTKRSAKTPRAYAISVGAAVRDGKLEVSWGWSPKRHHQATVERLAHAHLAAVRAIVAHARGELERLVGKTADVEDVYPLAPMQQGLLFETLYSPGLGLYAEQLSVRLDGELDVPAFVGAWQEAVDRHAVLRTSFAWEGRERSVQIVHRKITVEPRIEDWRALPAEERAIRLAQFLDEDHRRGFDYARAPLIRLALFRLADNSHHFVWTHSHLVLDGWSVPMVVGEVLASYEARRRGERAIHPTRPPYKDYVAWLERQDRAAAEVYWKRTFAGFTAPTPLPLTRERGDDDAAADRAYAGDLSVKLSPEASAAVGELARRAQVTLNTVVVGAWAILLARTSREPEAVVGVTVSGRPAELPDVESMVGMLINTLPLRVPVPRDAALIEWLRGLQARQAELRRFESSPLLDVQRWAQLPGGQRVFDSYIVFDNYPMDQALRRAGSFEVVPDKIAEPTSYPCTLVVEPAGDLTLRMLWDTTRFDRPSVERTLGHLRALLEGMARAGVDAPIGRLPLVTAPERALLAGWARDPVPTPPPRGLLHELFEAQAKLGPDRVAVSGDGRSLTYRELDRRANALAHRLVAHGVGPDVLVGLTAGRTVEMVVGLVAILKAGGAYVPLDPEYPRERLAFMLADAAPVVVLAEAHLASTLPAHGAPVILLDGVDAADTPPAITTQPQNLVYALYTSGSTGRPKGVMVTHADVRQLFDAIAPWFRYAPTDVSALFHSTAFDLSVGELWGALAFGGRAACVPYAVSRNPDDYRALLAREGVTLTTQTPSAFAALIDADQRASTPLALRTVIFCGEALDPSILRPWYTRHAEDAPRLVNMYGPTEATVYMTYKALARADAERGLERDIGVHIPGNETYVLDESLAPVPVGVAGELYLGGAGLARGYLRRPDVTAERFVPHPASTLPGDRLYRTGDLVRWLPGGGLDFIGRTDFQVKIRGFRVELGEIESVLLRHPTVTQAAVVVVDVAAGDRRLVAYVVGPGDDPTGATLRAYLAEELPPYMVPSLFVRLDAMPLGPTGKLDRRALPAPQWGATPAATDGDKPADDPRDEVEAILVKIWADVIRAPRVGIHDNFFALGGDSVLSIQVVVRAKEAGLTLTPRQIFEHQTVAELARVAERDAVATPETPVPAAPPAPARFALAGVDAATLARLIGDGDGVEDVYPLSPTQAGLLFETVYAPGSEVYFEQLSSVLHGTLDVAQFRRAWEEAVQRHSLLRTDFVWEGLARPLQIVRRRVELPFLVEDWSALAPAERETRLAAFLDADRRRGFELGRAPLMRCAVFKLSATEHQFVWSHHHLLLDGWSVPMLVGEVFTTYEARQRGGDVAPLARTPFRDYIAWLERQDPERAKTFWKDALRGFSAATPFGVDRPPTSRRGDAGFGQRRLVLDATKAARITAFAREHALTPYTVVLGAWSVLLARYANERDVVFGTMVSGRPAELPGIESMIGLFIATLPVRVKISEEDRVLPWLQRLQALQADLREVEYSPLVDVHRWSDVPSGQPLFESIVAYGNYPIDDAVQKTEASLRVGAASLLDQSHYPLTLTVDPGDELKCFLFFDQGRFDAATIERMAGHLGVLLEAIGDAAPDDHVARLPVLTAAERHELLTVRNRTAAPWPREETFVDVFEAQVDRDPAAIAALCAGQTITYGELDARANRLARTLTARGVGVDDLVGLLHDRDLDFLVAMIGVFKAGAAYVPLDPGLPRDRLTRTAAQANLKLLVRGDNHDELARAITPAAVPASTLTALLGADPSRPVSRAVPRGRAYVIFTSGSTGTPKGAMIEHAGMLNHLRAKAVGLGYDARETVAQNSVQSFDVSVWQYLSALVSGGRTSVFQDDTAWDPAPLLVQCARDRVTVFETVPTHMNLILDELEAHGARYDLSALRWFIVNGEPLHPDLCARWFRLFPKTPLINAYGPTECSDDIAHYVMRAPPRGDWKYVPIDGTLPNLAAYVIDPELTPVPVGVAGELTIGGIGVGRGYLDDPVKTAQSFIPDPFAAEPGARLYRSGDLVRLLPDGSLEFLRRIDHQVKIRGFRIELGEIEVALGRAPGVREAVVVAHKDDDGPGSARLIAYVTALAGQTLSVETLRTWLGERLPDYMVPSAFVALDALPLTPNGKVDRKALPAPDATRVDDDGAYVAPQTDAERALADIWAGLLRVERVGRTDNFFTLGGDSILSIQLVSRAKAAGLGLTLRDVFEHATLDAMAAVGGATRATTGGPVIVTDGPAPLSPIQSWFFAQEQPELHHDALAVAVDIHDGSTPDVIVQAVNAVLAHHEAFRLRFALDAGGWVQRVDTPDEAPTVERVALAGLDAGTQEQRFREHADDAHAGMNLIAGPIARALLFDLGPERPPRLLLSVHHLAIDLVSWRIVLEDVTDVLAQVRRGEPPKLVASSSHVLHVAHRLSEHARSAAVIAELPHWLGALEGARLPLDGPGGANTLASAKLVQRSLGVDESKLLLERATTFYRAQPNELLLTALVLGVRPLSGQDALTLAVEGHGRDPFADDVDASRVVGWFTTIYPLRLALEGATGAAAVARVKGQLRAVPEHGLGFGLLRHVGPDDARAQLAAARAPELIFNYFGKQALMEETGPLRFARAPMGQTKSARGLRPAAFEVNVLLGADGVEVAFEYSEHLHRKETVEAMADGFVRALRDLVAGSAGDEVAPLSPTDFPLAGVDQETLDALLGEVKR